MYVSSASNASASAGVAKYPPISSAGPRVHSTWSSTCWALTASAVTRRGTAKPFARRAGLGPSDRAPVTGAPAGRADKAAGSFLPVLAIGVFPSTPQSRRRCGSVLRVRQPGLPCQMKPTTDCGDATHNAQDLVGYPQVVDRVRTGPRREMHVFFRARRTASAPSFPCPQVVVRRRPLSQAPGVQMKTLTEFSGTLIRMAARAEAMARKALPPELTRIAPPPVVSEGVTAKPNENASPVLVDPGGDSPTESASLGLAEQAAGVGDSVVGASEEPHLEKPGEAGTSEDEVQPGAHEEEDREEAVADQDLSGQGSPQMRATPGGAKPSEVNADEEGQPKGELEAENSAVKEILDKAVSDATGTTAERLERLREALKAVGRQADRVRLVRVFGSEEEVPGAKKIGEHQYVVDLMPQSMKQSFERDERGARRGPRRPSGGGKKGAEGSLEGSFSMESVMQDRRSEAGRRREALSPSAISRGGPWSASPAPSA